MSFLRDVPFVGQYVIAVIAVLFVLSVFALFGVWIRYRNATKNINNGMHQESRFLRYLVNRYEEAYEACGKNVNTPAVIDDAIRTKMGGALLFERFINNAVSIFVTLGLFGTFLGLSMSVLSLTSLIANSNTDEWLSILNSVGDGLMSTLKGMGVAFYTSLVGVACAIVFTILKSIWSPAAAKEAMSFKAEVWLDQIVVKSLPDSPEDIKAEETMEEILKNMEDAVDAMRAAMEDAGEQMKASMTTAVGDFSQTVKEANTAMTTAVTGLHKTVSSFNNSIHGFSDFNHALQGTVERLDLAARDLGDSVNKAASVIKKG